MSLRGRESSHSVMINAINSEHAVSHSPNLKQTTGEENERRHSDDTINPEEQIEEDFFPNDPREVSIITDNDHHASWCNIYEPSTKKGRQGCVCVALKMFRFSWSFRVVFLVTLLTSLVVVGISLWLFNHFIIRRGVRQVAKSQSEQLTLRVLRHVRDYVTAGPLVVQTIIRDMQWGDLSGLNFSDSRNKKSRKIQELFVLSQLQFNHKITTIFFATHYNYLTGVMVNDNGRIPPQRFILGISNGEGRLSHYPMNNMMDVAPRAHFDPGYFPTKRSWYVAAKQTGAIQWGQVFFTITKPPYLAVAVSGPYFDVHNGSLIGVLTAAINLPTISVFLESLVCFPETRLYIMQSDMILVAVNRGNLTNDTDPNNPQMVDARNSTDFVIRESAEIIIDALGVPLIVDDRKLVDLGFIDSTGKKRQISLIGIKDDFGLSWTLVSVISEGVVLKVVHESDRVLVIVTVCTIVGALLIALFTSILISVPLYEVASEFQKITEMNFRSRKKIHSLQFFESEVMIESINQLKNGLRCFDAYVPSDVVRVLMSRNASAQLGVVRRRMTIVFIETKFEDEKGFSPKLLVDTLQILFTCFSQIVADEGGVVDKYLAEGIMCLFNAPLSIDDQEFRSIRSCCKISQRMKELNREWTDKGQPNISLQIGVNTDLCYVGNVGSRSRVNYTALGDAVNVASRLMSLNKQYDTSMMIGPKTKQAVQDHYVCRWISFVCVKGKSQPIHVFEVLSERDTASDKQQGLESLTSQVSQFIEENELNSAHSLVLELLSEYPRDKALIELRERLEDPNFCPYVEVGSK